MTIELLSNLNSYCTKLISNRRKTKLFSKKIFITPVFFGIRILVKDEGRQTHTFRAPLAGLRHRCWRLEPRVSPEATIPSPLAAGLPKNGKRWRCGSPRRTGFPALTLIYMPLFMRSVFTRSFIDTCASERRTSTPSLPSIKKERPGALFLCIYGMWGDHSTMAV